MNNTIKVAIVVLLAVVVGAVLIAKSQSHSPAAPTPPLPGADPLAQAVPSTQPQSQVGQASAAQPLPKLVDLGAGKCIPCKAMAPILDELKHTYAGRFDVQFIDVWENRSAGEAYDIRVIPTQIFFDPQGQELFRHEGFFSREDILSTWKQLGFEFPAPAEAVITETKG
jgi:thioredoxin 1